MEKRESAVGGQKVSGASEWLRKNESVIARRLNELMDVHGVKNPGQLSRILRVDEKWLRAIIQRHDRKRQEKK